MRVLKGCRAMPSSSLASGEDSRRGPARNERRENQGELERIEKENTEEKETRRNQVRETSNERRERENKGDSFSREKAGRGTTTIFFFFLLLLLLLLIIIIIPHGIESTQTDIASRQQLGLHNLKGSGGGEELRSGERKRISGVIEANQKRNEMKTSNEAQIGEERKKWSKFD